MAKKPQKAPRTQREPASSLLDNPLAQSVRASARQIWLAGMGALSRAQRGRPKVSDSLVKKGGRLQRKTPSAVQDKAGDAGARAGPHWDKLEQIFEQRTAKALRRLGVPTAKDVQALIERVDTLAAAVQRLSKPAPAAAPKPARAARPAAQAAKTSTKAAAHKAAPRAAQGG
ncbi:MAG TPA: phasin family protein [Rubrivivax sp.]|nr:phasin family protein [Rubrivivax sp.]HPO18579.1 phasin family protein [Rubrivivax sp.]